MKEFIDATIPIVPIEQQEQFRLEAEQLIRRTRQRLLGEVQAMLANYNISRQADLDLLRKEIDLIFLEDVGQ